MMMNHFKPVILEKWNAEVVYHQRRLMNLMMELEHNRIYDEEIWTLVFDTILHKKRINNLTFFGYFLETMQKWNADPTK